MTAREALRSLVGRIETEEPSRELDAEIAAALCILPPTRDCPHWLGKSCFDFVAFPDGTVRENFGNGKFGFTWESARLTSSIDAKLAGEDDGYWIIRGPHKKRWHACYHPPGTGAGWDGEASTEAMARRAAYLKSQLAEKEARDDTATNEQALKNTDPEGPALVS